ncbi:MAG: hypothetical protein QNL15_16230 [Pseudomonadales bacterium]
MNKALQQPKTERPSLLLVVGYPEAVARVPDIGKRLLEEITILL